MAINKETQVNASVVLEKDKYEILKQISKNNKRSVSAQMAFIIENFIDEYVKDFNKK